MPNAPAAPAVAAPTRHAPRTGDKLQDHMLGTYHSLRLGIFVIGLLFPAALWLGGLARGVSLQPSISAYYYTPLRDVFVGVLVAIGLLLYLYKGFSTRENVALNAAGIFAVGVANLPTVQGDGPRNTVQTLHVVCAVAFFLCIAYVAIRRSVDTLKFLPTGALERRFRRTYRTLGSLMIAFPAFALVMSEGFGIPYTFNVEAAGIVVFALYWGVKSWEMAMTQVDQRAAAGELTQVEGKPHSERLVVEEPPFARAEMEAHLRATSPGKPARDLAGR